MKNTKKMMCTLGVIGLCFSSIAASYIMINKKKQCLKEMMAYFENE